MKYQIWGSIFGTLLVSSSAIAAPMSSMPSVQNDNRALEVQLHIVPTTYDESPLIQHGTAHLRPALATTQFCQRQVTSDHRHQEQTNKSTANDPSSTEHRDKTADTPSPSLESRSRMSSPPGADLPAPIDPKPDPYANRPEPDLPPTIYPTPAEPGLPLPPMPEPAEPGLPPPPMPQPAEPPPLSIGPSSKRLAPEVPNQQQSSPHVPETEQILDSR